MPSQLEFDKLYMDLAFRISRMSKAKRLQVGAIIVEGDNILSYGYNGMPKGSDNVCEYVNANNELTSKPNVIHGEMAAMLKLISRNSSIRGATMYITDAPCLVCSSFILQTGCISEIVYSRVYRLTDGIDFLESNGIKIRQFIID